MINKYDHVFVCDYHFMLEFVLEPITTLIIIIIMM